MKMQVFRCPQCGGSHFGSMFPNATGWINGRAVKGITVLGEPLRHCHDEFNRHCEWTGSDAECMKDVEYDG